MANVQPYEIIAGPAKVYVAPTGTVFPAATDDESAFGSAWIKLGQTDGGVKVAHTQTVVELLTDQVTAPVKAVRSQEGLEISFSLAELKLENYAAALNQAEAGPIDGVSDKTVNLYRGGSQVETLALFVRGDHLSPYADANLQYEVPAVYQSDAPSVEFTKAAKSVLACTFTAIADPNRSSDDEAFGVLRAATS